MQTGDGWRWGRPIGSAALAAAGGIGLSLYSAGIAREAERLAPADGGFLDVEGARLHYVDRGSGPAIVMVHGLGGQLRNFSYAMLDSLAADHRVILVDRPGSGYSLSVGDQPDIPAQAAIVARLIATLGLERPLLVGHSLGGAVALALALDHGALIRGLALIAPLTQHPHQVPAAFTALAAMPGSLRRVMAQTIGTPVGRWTAERTRRAAFAPEPAPADFATRGGGVLALRPGNIAAGTADLAAAHRDMAGIAARYPQLDMPTAILFGRSDAILDPALHGVRTAAVIPAARLTLVDGGHMLPITQAETTIRFVREADRAAQSG